MQMLDSNGSIDQLAKANSVRWYGHEMIKEKINIVRRALHIKVKGTRKTDRPLKTWLMAALDRSKKIGLGACDSNNSSGWRIVVNNIPCMMR